MLGRFGVGEKRQRGQLLRWKLRTVGGASNRTARIIR